MGFAKFCPAYNQLIAQQTVVEIVKKGYGLAVGNHRGTFYHALKTAKYNRGRTLAIVEDHPAPEVNHYCDRLKLIPDTTIKHQLLAQSSVGAIVIGGGEGSKRLIDRFLHLERSVVAIANTGGIVKSELDDRVIVVSSPNMAIDNICQPAPNYLSSQACRLR